MLLDLNSGMHLSVFRASITDVFNSHQMKVKHVHSNDEHDERDETEAVMLRIVSYVF